MTYVQPTRFASSQHVSEFKKENAESGSDDNAPLCIDGFFNNLNCLAVFLAHTIDSLHRATSDYGEEEVRLPCDLLTSSLQIYQQLFVELLNLQI